MILGDASRAAQRGANRNEQLVSFYLEALDALDLLNTPRELRWISTLPK
jgi:hypothetical protein